MPEQPNSGQDDPLRQSAQEGRSGQQRMPAGGQVAGDQPLAQPTDRARRRRRVRTIVIGGAILVLLMLIGGGAGAAWWYFGGTADQAQISNPSPSPAPQESAPQRPSADEVIPASAELVLAYHPQADVQRARLAATWKQSDRTAAGGPALRTVRGDPRVLIERDVSQWYYVRLPERDLSWLLAPATEAVTTLFEGSEVVGVERNGWYIAHPRGTETYITELERRSMSDAGRVITDTDSDAPMHVAVSEAFRVRVYNWARGIDLPGALLEREFLTYNMAPNKATDRYLLADAAVQRTSPEPTPSGAASGVLKVFEDELPPGIEVVYAGRDFADAWGRVRRMFPSFDTGTLANPDVEQLVAELDVSFAAYRTQRGEIGAIITLPRSLRGTLSPDDPSLAALMRAFAPVAIGERVPDNLAFGQTDFFGDEIRFINIADRDAALDYTVTEQRILFATSKRAMEALLDAVRGRSGAALRRERFARSADHRQLLTRRGDHAMAALIPNEFIGGLLPLSEARMIPIGLTISGRASIEQIDGSIPLR